MNTDNLVLRPNCLLTKYPIVFITGPRSLFHHEKLGAELQDFIAAHGYQVLCPALPFRNRGLRRRYLSHWLRQQSSGRFHFVAGGRTFEELGDLLAPFAASRTRTEELRQKLPAETRNYTFHRLFCRVSGSQAAPFAETLPDKSSEFYDRFLDHCVDLAENESL